MLTHNSEGILNHTYIWKLFHKEIHPEFVQNSSTTLYKVIKSLLVHMKVSINIHKYEKVFRSKANLRFVNGS